MGSLDAMKSNSSEEKNKSQTNGVGSSAASRYYSDTDKILVAQGVTGTVLDKGSLKTFIPYLTTGLKHSCQDIGVTSLDELRKSILEEKIRFEKRSVASQVEGGVHGLVSYEKKLY
jgi:IMP dehydrogenase